MTVQNYVQCYNPLSPSISDIPQLSWRLHSSIPEELVEVKLKVKVIVANTKMAEVNKQLSIKPKQSNIQFDVMAWEGEVSAVICTRITLTSA